jgi:hypothetical protein
MNDLPDADRALLEFERQRWLHVGMKEQAIREKFGISPTRYWQRLFVVLDKPEALIFDPVLVKRLRRLHRRDQAAG